jgi:DNA anti-recombination protein RmuC
METKQIIQRINKRKGWFFEEIDKIVKSIANMTRGRRENTQINKIQDEKGDITTNTTKCRGSLGSTLKTFIQVTENLEEMDKFLDAYNQLILNQ